MATTITAVAAPSFWSAEGYAVAFDASDPTNGNDFVATRDMLLIVHNSGVVTRNITITSQPLDTYGRSGDVAESLAAGEVRIFRLTVNGWADGSGMITLDTDHADVLVKAINLVA